MQKIAISEEAARQPLNAILLVSDDKHMLATIGGALRSAGFEVIEALDGVTALETCSTKLPSLAIIDNQRSNADSIGVAQQLTSRFFVPFVYLSADDDEAMLSAAVAAGAMAYLVKPVDSAQIVPAVRAALRRSQELRALQSQTERLGVAVQTGKQIGIATGLIMANLRLDQQEAFERLRRQARSRRARLEDVAAELLRVADETGGFYRSLGSPDATRRRAGEDIGIVVK